MLHCICVQTIFFCIDLKFISYLILTALLHIELINVAYLPHVPLSGHDDVALFEWRVNDIESTKNYKYVIIASLTSESGC